MKRLAHPSALLALLLLTAGCKRDDDKRLKAVGYTIGSKVGAVLNRTNDRLTLRWYEGAGQPLPPVEVRVDERLRWDRDLEGSSIQVTANGTLIELHGSVVSATQRQHAADLAGATVGVERVVTYLVVGTSDNR